MRWKKLGRVFCASGEYPWMQSHAANPVALPIGEDRLRVFFNARDANNRSSVGWIEIDPSAPERVLRRSMAPSLSPGPPGTFDDSGCSIGSILRHEGRLWLYYMGWNLGVTVPWRNAIGLAFSEDEGVSFERLSLAPIMDRSDVDPYTISYPCVIREGSEFRMWYGSNLDWGVRQSDMHHVIKSATSVDGIAWVRDGKTCIVPDNPSEYAFARPSVVRDRDLYRMWFAYRGDTYRIGYAESRDGTEWHRKASGFDLGPDEWDARSVAYPFVFDHRGQRYMLYCGNEYGRSGFGLAVLETP